ncbi:bola protein [Protomyces lactucae-debilis]|uniref:Bola protein n=1 Tax=Protomyces lactucae-debilis TaxID=2754530 RepID=A0A1Y2FQ31_PROLT|nr:bola protein [Protomyces lactucae-debilis]ORY84815.1 bola protein [Protomyces lactucae-debilis]
MCFACHREDADQEIYTKLQEHLSPTRLTVKDVSGGCGSAYAVEVSSKQFEGLNVIKQQRLVNSILKEEIKNMHALQLKTSVD